MTTLTKPARSDRELARLTLARVGRNEALARGPGDDRQSRGADERLAFHCECEGERYRETLLLTLADYTHLRAQAGQLIVAPGHQFSGTRVEQRLDGCFIVQRTSEER